MSDNVKNLFERSGNAKQRSVLDALRSAIADIESGAISPNKLVVLMLDDRDYGYRVSFEQAGMRCSEMLALAEVHKAKCLELMGKI